MLFCPLAFQILRQNWFCWKRDWIVNAIYLLEVWIKKAKIIEQDSYFRWSSSVLTKFFSLLFLFQSLCSLKALLNFLNYFTMFLFFRKPRGSSIWSLKQSEHRSAQCQELDVIGGVWVTHPIIHGLSKQRYPLEDSRVLSKKNVH